MTRGARAYIGASGYQYDHWRGPFYPADMPKHQWFDYYCRHFNTVEINNTFYHLPDAATFEGWHDQASNDFCYTLKFSRYGSHMKCLQDPASIIGRFMERAARLGSHLGPILVQLKPNWNRNLERLRGFLEATPAGQRWAFEFRDPSWLCDAVFELLRRHNAALCVHDMLDGHPDETTADWVYLRFHGNHYSGSYSHQYLTARARTITDHLGNDRDVYAYFNNDADGHAVRNALMLREYIRRRKTREAG